MDLALAALLLATMTTGLAAGVFVFWQHTVAPGLRMLDDRTFVAAFQALDRAIINPWFMLTAFGGALVFSGAATLLHLGDDAFGWILSAFALYLVTVVITMAVNVPRNDALKAAGDPDVIDVAAARAAFDEARWSRWNLIRSVLSSAAFVLLAWALVVVGGAR